MAFKKNFKAWLNEYEGAFVFENVKPYPEKVKNIAIKKLVTGSKPQSEQEAKAFQEKAEKLISEFEFIKSYPNEWWNAETRTSGGTIIIGMNDAELNKKIIPEIEAKNRKDITAYSNLDQLEAVINHSKDVVMYPKDINKSLKKMLIDRFVQNSKADGGDGISEYEAKTILDNFERHRKYYNFIDWKKFLLQKSTNDVVGMGDKNFSLAVPDKGIPDIPVEERYYLKNYEYYQQLEKLNDRLDSANLLLMVKASNVEQNKELTPEEILAKRWKLEKILLAGIKVVHEDDDYIIYLPKDAQEAIRIKDAEASATEHCPGWCICYKHNGNAYNNYRYNANRTFYIVKNKKILDISKQPLAGTNYRYEFFVVGVEPHRMVVTPQPNGDQEMTKEKLIKTNPNMAKYIDLFKFVELTNIEKDIKRRFQSNISAHEYSNLKIARNIYYQNDNEVKDQELIDQFDKTDAELPEGVTRKTINEKDLFLDICGVNVNLSLDVFKVMSKDEQNKYVGFMKLLDPSILKYMVQDFDKGEPGTLNRHSEIACRVIANNTRDPMPVEYAEVFKRTFNNLTPECISHINKNVLSKLYEILPDRERWHKKLLVDGKISYATISKFDDNAKKGWIKAEITATGLKNTFADEFYKSLLISLKAENLADLFKEFGLNNICSVIKVDEIRNKDSSDWNIILKFASFDDIMKFMPESVVKNLHKESIVSSYMAGNENSAINIKNYFKDKFGDSLIMSVYPNVNVQIALKLASLYDVNPQRFQEDIDQAYLSMLGKQELQAILDALQKQRSSFTDFYFNNTSNFAPSVTKMLIVNSDNKKEMADKIIHKFGNDLPKNVAYEILISVTDPQDSQELFKTLNKYTNSFSSDEIIDLISTHGPKHAVENLGQETYSKHEKDDESKEKTNSFYQFYSGMREKLAQIPEEQFDSDDAEFMNPEKKLKDFMASLQKVGKSIENDNLTDEEKNKLYRLKNAIEMQKVDDYLRLARNPMQRQPKLVDWIPSSFSQPKKMFMLKRMLANRNLQISSSFIEELFRKGLGIENFDEFYKKIKLHNPENVTFLRNIEPNNVAKSLGILALLKPSSRLIREFLADLGPANSKALLQQVLNQIMSPHSTWYMSIEKIKDHALKYGKKWVCSTDNFAIDRIKMVAQTLGAEFDWNTLPVGQDCPAGNPAAPVQ